jgi:WhiB family redox-sensing transcriptional regulator
MPDMSAFTLTRAGASAGLDLSGPPPSWADRAACTDTDPELFFSPDGERGQARVRREQRAKAVCARCDVRAECLTYAVDTKQRDGVWGGLDEEQRRPLIAFTIRNGATR